MALRAIVFACLSIATSGNDCKKHTLDFILLAGDPLMAEIEDDVKSDLAKIGITVNTRLLQKADFNTAMQAGDFHLCFTESWGPPYDPQAFATGFFRPNNEAHYKALDGLEAPMTKQALQNMVTAALREQNLGRRQEKWTEILQEMHTQAISNPMWSKRMPAVVNRRLQNYRHGAQQYDYPIHNVEVSQGSKIVTVAPGAQTGMFTTTGPMDPHTYRPNEFFISNWIYEGLVYYPDSGTPEPMLAISWTIASTPDGGQEYTFRLRPNVTFHDGTAFNCAAAKMNFDHVLQPPLNTLNYHGWYHLPTVTQSWRCSGEEFIVKLSEPYYPFLQELSLIRPLRMLSPNSFKVGPTSSPVTHNSCQPKSNPVKNMDGTTSSVNCVGIASSKGTGPWIYDSTTNRGDGSISEVKFIRNQNWWGSMGNIEELIVKNYASNDLVKAALLDNSLDMVVGGGVLTPTQVTDLANQHSSTLEVTRGPPLMNTIIVINAAKSPTDDLQLRKVIMHATNKGAIVAKELGGSSRVADSLFPKDAPYCDVDLTPRYDYDIEKAKLMNCPVVLEDKEKDDDLGLILGISLGVGIPLLLVIAVAGFCIGKRKGYAELKEKMNQKPGSENGAPPQVVGGASA